MASLELAVRIPEGRESDAAREVARCIPAAMRATMLRFAAAVVAQLESAEHSVLVVDLPAAQVERLLADLDR